MTVGHAARHRAPLAYPTSLTVATTLLANLVERGLDTDQGVVVVIDGAKALRKAVRDVLGVDCPVQRCVRHSVSRAWAPFAWEVMAA